MNFLHIIATLDPSKGGPVTVVRSLSVAMKELGQHSEVITLDGAHAPGLDDFPGIVHALGPSWGDYCFNPHLVGWLRLNAGRFDAVIAHGLWIYPGFATWLASRKVHFPYFVYTHGMLDPWFKRTYPLKQLKKWLYWPWADYRVLRDAKAVLFTNAEEKRLASKSFWLYKANEAIVNHGIASPEGNPLVQRRVFFNAFPFLQNKQFVLFLSRIDPKKGCDLLIDAFGQISKQYPDLYLVIAGPDQKGLQANLMQRAARLDVAERITWTGMLNGDMKWGAFHAADAFILPSHSENFGIVVAEALACKLPVLITDRVNIWCEIKEDNAGIVAPDTLEGITCLLLTWMDMNPNEKRDMRIHAQRCFENRFEYIKAGEMFIETIAGLVKNDGQG